MTKDRQYLPPMRFPLSAIMPSMRRAVFVVPPIQILDLTGPFEVFARCSGYRTELVSSEADSEVRSSSGLRLAAARHYRNIRCPIDTLLVVGGEGAEQLRCDSGFLSWLSRLSAKVRRIGSICTGAFVLGAAGILDGRSATTHWAWCDRLARKFPEVDVKPDSLFVRDGHICTSAGVTAGIDMALSMVQEDHGVGPARTVARDLVMYLQRTGGQSQFSSFLAQPAPARRPIEEIQRWIPDHLAENLTVDALAARCAMSPRNFARVFASETGVTPARFVEKVRVLGARGMIEESPELNMDTVSSLCGFGSPDSMRRAFLRSLALSPSQYRKLHGVPNRLRKH
jgi:transcriptional regulator GlxA family with amidase domain